MRGRGGDEQHGQPGEDEDRHRGVLEQGDVDRAQVAGVDVSDVVPQRVDHGRERHGEVAAAVREQREVTLDDEVHRDFQQAVRRGWNDPDQVGQARAAPPAGHRDEPGDGDGRGSEQNRFPGDRAEGEQNGGEQVAGPAAPAVGQQAAQHAGLGQRLRGVPADADDQAKVGGEGEPPQGVAAGLAGEHAAQDGHRRHREQVDPHQGSGHELVLAQ